MKTKIIALILILTLCVGLFAGCGDTAAEPEVPEASAEPAEPVTYKTFDYKSAYESRPADEIVMTVSGTEITWKEYFGWLYSIIEQYEMYMGAEFAWSDPYSDTQSLEEYAKYYTETMLSQYAIVAQAAKDSGIELSDEEKQTIDDMLASDAQNYTGGDIDAFIEFLESTYMDEEYYRYIQSCAMFYQKLFEVNFGANGEKLNDEDVEDFINTNGFLYAKHILFLTKDTSGTSLDDAAKTEKLAKAEECLAQLNGISDKEELLAKFDELMYSVSEDAGLVSSPNGYYFLPGEMVTEFEEGVKALENYAVSDIIESPYGYHIILRLPIGYDDEYSAGVSFRLLASQYAYDVMMGLKFQSAEIVYSDSFANFSLDEIMKTIEVTQ